MKKRQSFTLNIQLTVSSKDFRQPWNVFSAFLDIDVGLDCWFYEDLG